MAFTYLLINLLTVAFPLAASWDKRFRFASKWKWLLPAIILTAIPFLAWDVLFTRMGVWGFNPEYLSGISLFGLPLGEYLFFLTVPYACLFIYEVVLYYQKEQESFSTSSYNLIIITGAILLPAGIFFHDKFYTSVSFILAGSLLVYHGLKRTLWLKNFLIMFLWTLIPFSIVNGALTALPVVWYNDSENLGIRLGSIPAEDIFYSFSMLIISCWIYETIKTRAFQKSSPRPILKGQSI